MHNVLFSPKSISYALVAHNHYKVGYAVQKVITDARKYGIKAPRLFDVLLKPIDLSIKISNKIG